MATIIHDSTADFVYVQFNEDQISHSVEWTPDIIVDVTEDDKIVGIQLLHINKQEPDTAEEANQPTGVCVKELRLVHA